MKKKTDKRLLFWEIGKWVPAVIAVVFIASMLSTGHMSQTDFSVMSEKIMEVADTSNMAEGDRLMIKRLYGINPDTVEGIMLYYPVTNMGAEEICLIKLADISQQEAMSLALERRVEAQINVFDGYGVEQTEMLKNAVIEVEGNYLLLVVANDPKPVINALKENL